MYFGKYYDLSQCLKDQNNVFISEATKPLSRKRKNIGPEDYSHDRLRHDGVTIIVFLANECAWLVEKVTSPV